MSNSAMQNKTPEPEQSTAQATFNSPLIPAALAKRGNTVLYGYLNEAGDTVIPPQWEKAQPFSCGVALVGTYPRFDLIDRKGSLICSDVRAAEAYQDGYSVGVDTDDEAIKVVRDTLGHAVFRMRASELTLMTDTHPVLVVFATEDAEGRFCGRGMAELLTGEVVLPPRYRAITWLGFGCIGLTGTDGKEGVATADGKILVTPTFDSVHLEWVTRNQVSRKLPLIIATYFLKDEAGETVYSRHAFALNGKPLGIHKCDISFDVVSAFGKRWVVTLHDMDGIKDQDKAFILTDTGEMVTKLLNGRASRVRSESGQDAFFAIRLDGVNDRFVTFDGKVLNQDSDHVTLLQDNTKALIVGVRSDGQERRSRIMDAHGTVLLDLLGTIWPSPFPHCYYHNTASTWDGRINGLITDGGEAVFEGTSLIELGSFTDDHQAVTVVATDTATGAVVRVTNGGRTIEECVPAQPCLRFYGFTDGLLQCKVENEKPGDWSSAFETEDEYSDYCSSKGWSPGKTGLVKLDGSWVALPTLDWAFKVGAGLLAVQCDGVPTKLIDSTGATVINLESRQAPDFHRSGFVAVGPARFIKLNNSHGYAIIDIERRTIIAPPTACSKIQQVRNLDNRYFEVEEDGPDGSASQVKVLSATTGKPLFDRAFLGWGVLKAANGWWICQDGSNGTDFDTVHFVLAVKPSNNSPAKFINFERGKFNPVASIADPQTIGFVIVSGTRNPGIYRPDGSCTLEGSFELENRHAYDHVISKGHKVWEIMETGAYRYGVVSPEGEVLIKPTLRSIDAISPRSANAGSEAQAVLYRCLEDKTESKEGGVGLIGSMGEWLLHPEWDNSSSNLTTPEGFIQFTQAGTRECWISPTGKIVVDTTFDTLPQVDQPKQDQTEADRNSATAAHSGLLVARIKPADQVVPLSPSASIESAPHSPPLPRRRISLWWLTIVIVLLRVAAPDRSRHEEALIDHLESNVATAAQLSQRIGHGVTGVSLRTLSEQARRSTLNMAGFQFHDYFIFTHSECDAAEFSAIGAASVVLRTK